MPGEIKRVIILGAGSAGLLSALAMQRAFPQWQFVVIASAQVPVIGVGESTTVLFPPFLHQSLAIKPSEFFARCNQVGSWASVFYGEIHRTRTSTIRSTTVWARSRPQCPACPVTIAWSIAAMPVAAPH